ncbi:MAG: hypothetical protein KKH98_06445 [Spirochaetes bacterium]|nr:hypothetical protein [Spirochaetota bacterium]
MIFGGNNTNKDIVHINDINEIRLHKIKPSDLGKKYIDKKGQEYKLKYDPIKKKVVIIKIIKSVLDGHFVTDKYDNIATDNVIKYEVKHKMGEMGKEFLKEKYNINGDGAEAPHQETKAPESEEKKQEKKEITSTDGIEITHLGDVTRVTDKIAERLEMGLKSILDSNVFDERYGFDDKLALDDMRRIIKADIIEEFKNLKVNYEDIFKGYNDSKLKTKLYGDEIKARLAITPEAERMNVMRQIEAIEVYRKGTKNILKAYDDIEYKMSIISEDKIKARNFHERQKFSDGKVCIQSCKNDTSKIVTFFDKEFKKMLKI